MSASDDVDLRHDRGDQVLEGLRRLAILPEWLTVPKAKVVGSALLPWSEQLGGEIGECSRHAMRLRTGYWACRYHVRIRRADGEVEVVVLSGELRPPGVVDDSPVGSIFLSELGLLLRIQSRGAPSADVTSDPDLPALAMLADPQRSARFIEAALHAEGSTYAGASISECVPEVMRYNPGSRCTLRYHLRTVTEATTPRMVVAKVHRGDKGLIAWNAMSALWASRLAGGDVVAIAEPLSYDPDLKVLLQGRVAGEATLKDIIGDALISPTPVSMERIERLIDKTADGLAALHSSAAPVDEIVTLDDELGEVKVAWRRLVSLCPEIAGAADALFEEVERIGSLRPSDPLVPSHRSFRPAQVLVDGDQIAFIDFDGFCRSEPALDVALFRATLRCYGASLEFGAAGRSDETMRDRLVVLDQLNDRFLARYAHSCPISPERVAAWELLDVFVHLQNAWTKVRPYRPVTTLPVIARLLSQSIASSSAPR